MQKRKYLLLMCGLALVLVFGGCSSDNQAVDQKTAEMIDVSDYFPPIGAVRIYSQYDTDGKTFESVDTVNLATDSEGNNSVYIHEKGGLAAETIKEYAVSSEEVKLVYVVNPNENKETAIVELANKPEWDKKDENKSVSQMTATDLTVKVPAGTYKNVIEIATTVPGDSKGKMINYYAPEVGLIKTVFSFSDGDKFTFSELKSVEMKEEAEQASK